MASENESSLKLWTTHVGVPPLDSQAPPLTRGNASYCGFQAYLGCTPTRAGPSRATWSAGAVPSSGPPPRPAARARAQRDAGDTGGWGSGPGWHDGVIATLEWAGGRRAGPPMAHPAGGPCSHPPSAGPPSPAEMIRERRAAEEHLEPGGYRHGSHSPGYADAVAATLAWLYGQGPCPVR